MGIVGTIALLVNVGVAALLFAYRAGNANMRSVWLCTRNDAISNIAVLIAAAGVFASGSAWPDLLIAALVSALALGASMKVLRQARGELRHAGGASATL
jgi:Co/Zn/Cd efflux system component